MRLKLTANSLRRLCLPLMATLALLGCGQPDPIAQEDKPRLGLVTSLPILWSGNDAFAALADAKDAPHWAKTALEADYALEPIDALTPAALRLLDTLILAQPRVLSPQENIALDNWVRAGGRALIFADPQLVGESDLPLGDPRRPLDSVLLSPILGRWGLALVQDMEEAALRSVPMGAAEMVVAAPGRFEPLAKGGARCDFQKGGLIASCAIGSGHVVLLADATLLEDSVGGSASPEALFALLGMVRENDGKTVGETRK